MKSGEVNKEIAVIRRSLDRLGRMMSAIAPLVEAVNKMQGKPTRTSKQATQAPRAVADKRKFIGPYYAEMRKLPVSKQKMVKAETKRAGIEAGLALARHFSEE